MPATVTNIKKALRMSGSSAMVCRRSQKKILRPADFEKMFHERLTPYVKKRILEYKFCYSDISLNERDHWIGKIVHTLLEQDFSRAGGKRLGQWERGWSENLANIDNNMDQAVFIPHYFGKYNIIRINRTFIRAVSRDFECNSLGVILDWLFDKYFREAECIYEFGCGTGHNLVRLRKINPIAQLWGLDWARASQKIIRKLTEGVNDTQLFARRFDYFRPDWSFRLKKDAMVYTVASLEQTGTNFRKFVSYLLKNKPHLCVHVEPIVELLDDTNLLDYLSIEYFKRRNYLFGFLEYLRSLEKKGMIKIHRAQRTYIGSLFIDGYSVIVWSPK